MAFLPFKSVRVMAVLGAAFLLGACALPVPLQVVSLVADGISYVTTQKSVADHGLSAMTGKDCALLRGLSDGEPCREVDEAGEADDGAVAVAALEDKAPAPVPVAPVEKAPLTVPQSVAPVATVPEIASEPIPNPDNGLYLIVGSFVKEADALRHATRLNGLEPKILHGAVKGVRVYRVGLGPLADGELVAARRSANDLRIYDAWAVNVTLPPVSVPSSPELQAFNINQ